MLFDPRPKSRREEVFDRDIEFEGLEESVRTYPITLLLGIRRVGKSSILRAYLNNKPSILVDCRELYGEKGHIAREDLIDELQKKGSLLSKLLSKFKAELDLKFLKLEPKDATLREILHELNEVGEKLGQPFILAFDEAQYLRFYGSRGGKELLALLAYAYDSLSNVRVIMTGSEVGLLHDFIGFEDYKSPLYGRLMGEVYIKPFDRETSMEFLRTGFNEIGVEISEGEIEKAVDLLDGIPGWLVTFGLEYSKVKDLEKALKRTLRVAKGLILGELKELEKRSIRYSLILQAIALGYNRWSLIRDYLAVKGHRTPEPRLHELLKNLKKMGWIEEKNRKYSLTDPVVVAVLKMEKG
ncbi:ATP-binding protein [Thermococcus sp.]|uniref:AAA family ATPase n=1 Tax=Thermococcus sp. TaxID=35749 RepID=UPI0019B6F2AF|nr:ATP-binding protein [Thermococcus sp.]MBC7095017.1 ATP-binding protein [Thermococcus sp.]